MKSANLVTEFPLKLSNERALSTGEPCNFEYVTLLQSFHRGALSITGTWLKAFNLPVLCPSYLDALLRLPCLADS